MGKYLMEIEINEKKIDEIMERLEKAKEEVYRCYSDLKELGVIHFTADDAQDSTPSA